MNELKYITEIEIKVRKIWVRLLKIREYETIRALNHVHGSKTWSIQEIKDRCKITINLDKSKTFSFDGRDLIIFYPCEWKEDEDEFGVFFKTESLFKRLY